MTPTFPDVKPDRKSKRTTRNRVLTANFGDGYSSTGLDGINTVIETWNLSFENYPTEDVDTIRNFLINRDSVESFLWQAPGDGFEKKWRQEGVIDEGFPGSLTQSISFTIRRVYN